MKHNVAIITARGGSESIPFKNLSEICGKPSIFYPIMAAKAAQRIQETFLFTDSDRIGAVAMEYGCRVIRRGQELCGRDVNHGDAICAAIELVREEVQELNIVTILLGDSVMINPELIDLSVNILEVGPQWDSAMSVWQANDDHPYRAMCLSETGGLLSFLTTKYGERAKFQTARQSYPPVYFYDQGVWTFRHDVPGRREGPSPWWWMGKNVFPIIRRWISGRDYHTQLDLDLAEWWINSKQVDFIENRDQINAVLDIT